MTMYHDHMLYTWSINDNISIISADFNTTRVVLLYIRTQTNHSNDRHDNSDISDDYDIQIEL